MASTINITVNVADSIAQSNAKLQISGADSTVLTELANYLTGLAAGQAQGTVIVTTRDTDPSVGTSGSNSTQQTISKA